MLKRNALRYFKLEYEINVMSCLTAVASASLSPKTARERGQVWNISLDDRIAVFIWSEMEIKRVYEGKRKETVRMLRTFEVHFRENRGATLLCKPNGIRC